MKRPRYIATSADRKPGSRGAHVCVCVTRTHWEAELEQDRNRSSDARWLGYGRTENLRRSVLAVAERFPNARFTFRHIP